MRFHRRDEAIEEAVGIQATAFRDEKDAALVMITSLSFDRCSLSSNAAFEIGEQLRLHIPGQGWIKAQVRSSADGQLQASFITECDS